jgi:hypothetical protein
LQEQVDQRVADEEDFSAAEELRQDVVAHQQDEDEHGAGCHTRYRQRQRHLEKGADGRGAQVGRSLQQPLVEFLERHVDRRHHQRQISVDGADQHRPRRVDEADIRNPDIGEPARDAFRPQQHDPRIIAQQLARPERRHDEHQQRDAPAGAHLDGEEIRHRESEDRGQQRAERRQRQRVVESLSARRKIGVILEGEAGRIAAGRRAYAERKHQHHGERHQQQQHEEHPSRREQQRRDGARPGFTALVQISPCAGFTALARVSPCAGLTALAHIPPCAGLTRASFFRKQRMAGSSPAKAIACDAKKITLTPT